MLEFNPFEDRLSRDLRNDLSEALVGSIESGNRQLLEDVVEHYRKRTLDSCYVAYLDQRLALYREALGLIDSTHSAPINRAVILWNLGLFFEVHEILEHAWYDATGDYKKLLQALIRAAGVYIKLEYGYSASAGNIAQKALPVLEENRKLIEPYFAPDLLIHALQELGERPPKLARP